MANIEVKDIKPAGAELFSSSESYMTELSEDELGISGGATTHPQLSGIQCWREGVTSTCMCTAGPLDTFKAI